MCHIMSHSSNMYVYYHYYLQSISRTLVANQCLKYTNNTQITHDIYHQSTGNFLSPLDSHQSGPILPLTHFLCPFDKLVLSQSHFSAERHTTASSCKRYLACVIIALTLDTYVPGECPDTYHLLHQPLLTVNPTSYCTISIYSGL